MFSLGIRHQSSNAAKGATAEIATAKHFRTLGYKVTRLFHGGTDLVITHKLTGEKFNIEVKFSSKNSDGKYRATTIKRNCTDHRKSDFIVFVCQGLGGKCTEFIIPTNVQGNKTFLCVTSNPETYSGKLSVYKDAWHLIGA